MQKIYSGVNNSWCLPVHEAPSCGITRQLDRLTGGLLTQGLPCCRMDALGCYLTPPWGFLGFQVAAPLGSQAIDGVK